MSRPVILNLFRRRAIFQSQKFWRAKGFYPAKTPHDRGGGCKRKFFLWTNSRPGGGGGSTFCPFFKNFFAHSLLVLGHHFLFAQMSKAWRVIHERPTGHFCSISNDFFHFFGQPRTTTLHGEKNILNVLGGPLLARGSEVLRAIFHGATGHYWPAGQGLRTTGLQACILKTFTLTKLSLLMDMLKLRPNCFFVYFVKKTMKNLPLIWQ